MLVPLPVVPHGAALAHRLGVRQGDSPGALPRAGPQVGQLQGVYRLPDVPAAGGGDVGNHPVLYLQAGGVLL